ncbi:flagellar FliJ family protein [Aestuariibacter sp. A3R04]|uniref:flagellar FliJ family protein n=1 Tax=Aestuariibacter sp. A3R04 TaxID=2841571 RepID=UPI001C08C961|nr:flagellar FliJ family protein [Aestuariibacter sp. A3R04]MBU3023110.1 flagellar FliJ family protein [Aestuariibacter sp. A3R04]
MKMLSRYLDTQKNKLDSMQKRQEQLLKRQDKEKDRFNQLLSHIDSLPASKQMTSTLALQNLSAVRQQVSHLCYEQNQKIAQVEQERKQQQQACLSQARYNIGIRTLLDKQVARENYRQQCIEQKKQDEFVSQLYARRGALKS